MALDARNDIARRSGAGNFNALTKLPAAYNKLYQ
jgi:hypothetical protein